MTAILDRVERADVGHVDMVSPSAPRLSRWWLAGAALVAIALCFAQAPGLIVDDTKLPVIMAPLAFMQNTLHLWNPQQYSGTVQSLSYGYLFPMGPFFALAHALHIPVWCAERLWLALLLTTAFWGVVRLAEALGIGGRGGRVLGALAYTFAPIAVTWAATSAALQVVALFPWLIVPLVHGSRVGSSPRRAAAGSGIALALMGGVNVAGVAATLPVAAIWLFTRQPGPRRRALIGWWLVAVTLACFWWVVALVIQSRYGYNYLPYTETPAVTTGTTSLFDALQGGSYWTNYFTLGGPLLPGAYMLVSSVGPILCTAAVSALGVAGLARRGIPERLFLVASLCAGVVAISLGYAGALSGPFTGGVHDLLATALAPFRNVSKFSPDVTLPVALGLAWLVSSVRWHPSFLRGRHVSRVHPAGMAVVGVVAVGALIGASAPFWQLKAYPPGGFAHIPPYWSSAARWLDSHQQHQTALEVPGAAFSEYTWGRPLDDPLSVLLNSSWTVRSLIPLGSDGNDSALDAVEASLDRGVPAAGMAAYLSRAGIDYVVERNDLDLAHTGAPPPAQVHQVLSGTAGLREVAQFGPVVPLGHLANGSLPVYDTTLARMRLHSVEIYQVQPPARIVTTYPASDPVILSGSSSSVLPLVASGTVTNRATILAGDIGAAGAATAPGATWVDTDGNQRRDVSFGAIRQNVSYVLGPGQRTHAAVLHVPENYAVVSGTSHETVEAPIGAASVSASSYGSTTLVRDPSEGPAAAFDGDPLTAWVADGKHSSVGQWVEIDFGREVPLKTITVVPLSNGTLRPVVRAVTISTQRGSVTRPIFPAGVPTTVHTPLGRSRWLRLTIEAVVPANPQSHSFFPLGAGLINVSVPGVQFLPALRVPADEAPSFSRPGSNPPVYSFNSPIANATLNLGSPSDDEPWMARRFTVPHSTAVAVTGTATPLPGPYLDPLLPPSLSTLGVAASSTLGGLPRFSAQNLAGPSSSPWIAGYGDFHPSITLRWPQAVSVGSVVLDPAPAASTARQVEISSPAGRRIVGVPRAGGTVTFAPMVTNTITIHFLKVEPPAHLALFPMPVGLDSVSIPALGPTRAIRPVASTPFSEPCGRGPTLQLDGHTLPTALSGTIGDLENLQPLKLTVCAPRGVPLAAGSHLLLGSGDGSAFKITSLTMAPASVPNGTTRTATIVGTWSPQHRSVRLGPGAPTYLVVAQNFNRGWKATLSGHTLEAVRVDGWQQAWLVPGGHGGVVSMTFTPDAPYRAGLVVGAVLLVLLVVLALPFGRTRDERAAGERRPLPRWALWAAGALAVAAVAGPLAVLLVPTWLIGRRWGLTALAVVAGAGLGVAGVAVAVAGGGQPGSGTGAFGPVAQAATATSLVAVIAALALSGRAWRDGWRRGGGTSGVVAPLNGATGTAPTVTVPVVHSSLAARHGGIDGSRTRRPMRRPRTDRLAGTPWGAPLTPPRPAAP